MKILLFILSLFLLFAGCTNDSSLEPAPELLVVRGYIYAGEPVADIQITKTLSLGSAATTAPPVNDAVVALVKTGKSYPLVASPGDSGYYHDFGETLTVESGDEFEIQVTYGEQVTTGQTTVPFPPENVTLSDSVVTVPQEFTPGSRPSDDPITLTWEADAAALFYVVIECIESDPAEITGFGGQRPDNPQRRMLFPPTNHNSQEVGRFNLSYFGKHVAKVYRVNQEYADLYESRTQDSRDLNEPLTNIENGLGIFSAFASQSVYFTVTAE
jgi:hypothetical protein